MKRLLSAPGDGHINILYTLLLFISLVSRRPIPPSDGCPYAASPGAPSSLSSLQHSPVSPLPQPVHPPHPQPHLPLPTALSLVSGGGGPETVASTIDSCRVHNTANL